MENKAYVNSNIQKKKKITRDYKLVSHFWESFTPQKGRYIRIKNEKQFCSNPQKVALRKIILLTFSILACIFALMSSTELGPFGVLGVFSCFLKDSWPWQKKLISIQYLDFLNK